MAAYTEIGKYKKKVGVKTSRENFFKTSSVNTVCINSKRLGSLFETTFSQLSKYEVLYISTGSSLKKVILNHLENERVLSILSFFIRNWCWQYIYVSHFANLNWKIMQKKLIKIPVQQEGCLLILDWKLAQYCITSHKIRDRGFLGMKIYLMKS